jgi:hypothetical protein
MNGAQHVVSLRYVASESRVPGESDLNANPEDSALLPPRKIDIRNAYGDGDRYCDESISGLCPQLAFERIEPSREEQTAEAE